MCRAISIMKQRVRQELFEEYQLQQRIQQRAENADEEIMFDFADRKLDPELPVIHDGQLVVYPWGNRSGAAAKLPKTGWCRQESLEAGKWRWLAPQSVVIPADFGLEKGVWFQVREGMQGIVVYDPQDRPHVYMLTQPASHYYQTMTKHERMPILVGEDI